MVYRAYFNRRQDAPLIWSIDEGSQASEQHVAQFTLELGTVARSIWNGKSSNPDTPVAWLEIIAEDMQIVADHAYFYVTTMVTIPVRHSSTVDNRSDSIS